MELNKPMTLPTKCMNDDDSEVNYLIRSLSEKSQSLVKVLTIIISIQLTQKLSSITKEQKKTNKLSLTSEVNSLEDQHEC